MIRAVAILLILSANAVSANDTLRSFYEKPLSQIDGVTIQQSWLFGTPQSGEHGGTLLFNDDNQALVVVEENKTPKDKTPNWAVRNVQILGAKSDGKFLATCYTDEGRSGDYIVLVDKNMFKETIGEYYNFKKMWKFNKAALQFEPIVPRQIPCQCEDCPK
jgi:1,2-phenylacetyl-CoA epoxidase PaaB subunit